MQRTLEDEENYENISVDINPNIENGNQIDSHLQSKEAIGMKVADSNTSTKKQGGNQAETSSDDEASVTEKHECDPRNQETCEETQEAETNFDPLAKGAFGSDIEGGNTAAIETEQVLETETQGLDQNLDLNKLAGDTMMIEDEEEEQVKTDNGENLYQTKDPEFAPIEEDDTEAGDTIRTADLLASEVAGSWACNSAPSCHGENDSPRSGGGSDKGVTPGGGGGVLHDSASVAAESQTGAGRNPEHEALTKMIGIVAPEMKGQFGGVIESDSEKGVASNSDTEDCSEDDDDGVGDSDVETKGNHNPSTNDHKADEAMDVDDDDEATQIDSL